MQKSMIILNGSPRPQGNTAALLKFLTIAAEKQHWQIEQFDLYKMKIAGCAHCDHCQKISQVAGCALTDDFTPLSDALTRAAVIVVASPVYCWSVSGCMSALLDRFYALLKTQSGENLLKNKKMVGVFSAGGDVFDGMDLCVEMLKRLSEFAGINYVGTLAAANAISPDEIAQRKNLVQEADNLIKEL